MKQIYFLIILIFLLPSCATLVTKKYYNLNVSSNLPNSKIQVSDSIIKLPSDIKIERSKNDIEIKLIGDTISKKFIIKSSLNSEFLYGNLCWIYLAPVAYLVDFTNQKRFYYGKSIILNSNDSLNTIIPPASKFYSDYFSKSFPTNQKQINLVLSFPYVNSFLLTPDNESTKINTGFWGISIGTEYFYKGNRFISINASAVSDFFVPVPAAIDISGEYEMMSSIYLSLTDNYKFNRFSVGYGINYSKNIWDFRYYNRFDPPPPSREPVKKASQSLGITLNSYHQFGKFIFVGIIYRPTFFNVYPRFETKYEHLISLDFALKFKTKK